MGRLDNRVAIVTGGAKGLGKAFCFALAKEGAKVVMAAHRMDEESAKAVKEIEAKGGFGVTVDVTDEESTLRMAEEAVKKFGLIDILVKTPPSTMAWAGSLSMRFRRKTGTGRWMWGPRAPGSAPGRYSPT